MSYWDKDWNFNNMEFATKDWFLDVVNSEFVTNILKDFEYTDKSLLDEAKQEELLDEMWMAIWKKETISQIDTVFAVDWWFNLVNLGKNTRIAYFKIGLNTLSLEKLKSLNNKRIISPKDINDINNSKVITFPFPIDNIKVKKDNRDAIKHVLEKVFTEYNLKDTLLWIFNLEGDNYSYDNILDEIMRFFDFKSFDSDKIKTNLGTVISIVEQTLLLSKLKEIYNTDKANLYKYLFIRDWTLSFSTKGSIFREKVAMLFEYLYRDNDIYFISLEKSGTLQNYMAENEKFFPQDKILPINDKFIKNELKWPKYYEWYYGWKIISSIGERKYVVNMTNSFADKSLKEDKTKESVDIILEVLNTIQSFYYDNSLLSIIFINQDVSISEDSNENLKKFTLKNLY